MSQEPNKQNQKHSFEADLHKKLIETLFLKIQAQ